MRITSEHLIEDGWIEGLYEHDAVVIGFSYCESGSFSLRMRRISGSIVQLSLLQVRHLGFRGFQNGCIVFDIHAWPVHSVPAREATLDEGAWAVLYGNDIPVEHLAPIIRHVIEADDSLWLVHMESSYGGSFAALCGGIEME